jgi:hypothetical protein
MTKLRAAGRFLLAVAASSFRGLRRAIKRLAAPGTGPFLSGLSRWSGRQPPGAARDPYAWRPVPRKPQPKARGGAVAVAEPEE